ncbi:MAG: hypothetical protein P8N31_03500 [Planctomycetota bacterium]|jgi:histidinol-phosphate/aromatic aminotransferase/cobyric acid decarboxylase-like protein|nr:hypothetical protein [Planctomycetota bacterium]MDG2142598.1 hypothetical protein [Planctomycetota bacterium]
MFEDRERFFSRLSTVNGLVTMPSLGGWILVCVEDPSDLARKVNRRTEPGTVSVPRQVKGAVRLPVRSPKENEALFSVIREVMELRTASVRRVVG